MGQFLNYITKKQAGGDIGSLPGVLSLSKIQKDIQVQKEKRANKKGPTLSQYTPKPGDAERMQANREAYLAEQNKPLNRLAASQFAANLMDNILEPMFALEAGYGAGQLVKAGVKRALTKAPTHSEELVRGHINYFDDPKFVAKNPHFNHDAYVNSVGKFGNSTVDEIDPSLIPFDMSTLTKEQYKKFMSNERLQRRKYIDPFTNKKKGGAIVDPRGQWAHPGKDTIIPTKDGRITMKGVSYPVYGQDETGYGQLMMPGGEYSFPGKTIYEKPLDMFNYEMAYGGQMITRKDGSKSKRGLWDNIRANKGSGKKPTKEMLDQESRIRALEQAMYGMEVFRSGGTFSGNMYYQEGGEPRLEDYPDFGSYRAAYEQWLSTGEAYPMQQPAQDDNIQVAPQIQEQTQQAPAPKAAAKYSGPSVVDMLTSMGKSSDYQSRKQLAQELGIANYRGTAAQNTQMIRMLMGDAGVLENYKAAPKKTTETPSGKYKAVLDATNKAVDKLKAGADEPSNFFETAKRAYLAAHPGMTSEEYDRNTTFRGNPNSYTQSATAPKGKGRQGEYSDAFILSQIDRDPRSQKNINKRKRQEFAQDLAVGTLAPWLAEGALMALTTRYLPHGLKALPQVVEKAREASRALPAPMKRLPGPSPRGFVTSEGLRSPGFPMYMNGGAYPWKKQFGGPMEGEELEVTPEELEMLRAQGYEFEMI